MTILLTPLALILVFLFGSVAPASASGSQDRNASTRADVIAFLHATVIPMDKERVLRDHTVIVANGRIAEIGPASSVKVPDEAFRVDATGRYLLPALCDMHVHLLSESWNMMLRPEVQSENKDIPFESFLFPFVANGVTMIQDMSATPDDLALRQRIDRGELLGPRVILARMVDGPDKAWPPPLSTWVATASEAENAVRGAKEVGYDKIKVYSFLSRESYDAITATSRELEMDVIGHIPMSLSVEYVLDAGQKLIAHSEEVMKHAGGDYSAQRINYYADRMVAKGVWMTPTLVTTRAILEYFADPNGLHAHPEAEYFHHPMQVGVWSFITDNLYRPIPTDKRAMLQHGFEAFQRPLTREMHKKGGKLMTGTDSLFPGLVPGFSLHRELHELVDVGLTPYEALRTSTTNPFEYLGETSQGGTVEVGKQSDLLLLDANPLEDISAVSGVAGVLMRGRWLDRKEIQVKMQGLATSFKAHSESPSPKDSK